MQGNDLTITGVPSGPVAANTPVTLHVTFDKTMTPARTTRASCSSAHDHPTAVSVPITVHRQ